MMKRIKILLFLLLFSCVAQGQTPSWVTDWYTHLNTTMINGPANGGTRTYVAGLFDSVVAKIWQQTRIKVSYTDTPAMLEGYARLARLLDSLSNHWTAIQGKQAALGFTPVTNARQLTINGTTYDLTADRSWTVTAVPDSYLYATKDFRKKGDDSVMAAAIGLINIAGALKLNIADSTPEGYATRTRLEKKADSLIVWALSTFLTSYTETDPVFLAYPAAGIGAGDISNWNDAYNRYPTAASFNTSTGVLTITRRDGTTVTVDLDGRYLETETDPQSVHTGASAGGDLTGTYPNPTVKSSVALSGNPTTTTQTQGDNSTKIATTAYVDNFYKDTTTTSFTTSMKPTIPVANKLYTVQYNITAQAGALLIDNPNITMANGQLIIFAIQDNGTPVALTYGADYRAGSDLSSLPSTTTANKFLYLEFMRNATDGKLDLIGKANGY